MIKKIITFSCEAAAVVGMLSIFILLILTVADVVGRFVFNHPIPGTFELTKILFAVSVFFSLPVSQYRGENLSITLLYDTFSNFVKGIFDCIISLLCIGTFSITLLQTLKYAARMRSANTITSVLRWPLYPWIYLAAVGLAILVLALILDLFNALSEMKRGEK